MNSDVADTHESSAADTISKRVKKSKGLKRKIYKCNVCGIVCSNKRTYGTHERTHLFDKEIKCALCDRKFDLQRLLTQHYRRHSREELSTIGVVHFCCRCGAGYDTSEECSRHEKNQNCSTQEKNHTCVFCGRAFGLKRALKAHIMTHTGEKPHVCPQCGRFITRSLLLKHETIHTGEASKSVRACDKCGKTFRSSGGLSNHFAQQHLGISYPCETCGKEFNSKEHLKQHILIHTGIKSHICQICGKAFTYRNGLLSHSYSHVKKTDRDKPYVCDTCGKAFGTKNEIYRHYQIHSGEKPHECEYCGKSFNQKFTLRVHQRQHTGEKPYKCKYCDMRFISHSGMRRHEVHHMDEQENVKRFLCDMCGMTFKIKSALAHHKKHHKAAEISVKSSNKSDQNQKIPEVILPDVVAPKTEALSEESGTELIADLSVECRTDE